MEKEIPTKITRVNGMNEKFDKLIELTRKS
jgi:hypothetical protein